MTDSRRSRRGWHTTPIPPPDPDPVQRRLTPIVAAYVSIMLLVLTVALLVTYIVLRSHARDVEQRRTTQQIERQIVRNNCDLLDALPSGGPLVPLRAKYRCGPGLPRP